MAYRIKNVRYQDEVRKILLQNENGPCPLLAAANALLLRGVIELPASSLRSRVVSIEELVTIFADRALKKNDSCQTDIDLQNEMTEEEKEAMILRKTQSQHQIDELMEILPGLQYGMDINPKFMHGPEGYEYTKNLTAFDLMGVDLFHGWLVDPKDKTAEIIGNKTYNELIEVVVKGKDGEEEINKFHGFIKEKQKSLNDIGIAESNKVSEDDEEKVQEKVQENVQENEELNVNKEEEKKSEQQDLEKALDGDTEKNKEQSDGDPVLHLKVEIKELEQKCFQLQELATKGHVVEIFLRETGHQLTRYGLEKLHEHMQEMGVCVFFRNNHFSTMTMFEGQLFLLVTDLGYATVDEVVWEKLDAIDGNTDYFNSFFLKTDPGDDFIMESGSTLTPEQMMAQRGQSEIDYELALSLSKHKNSVSVDEEALQAAKNLSLQEWNKNSAPSQNSGKTAVSSNPQHDAAERDRQIALSLQAQYEGQDASERLARQLHMEERQRQEEMRIANEGRRKQSKSESSCVIS